jgi:hypothetical protein
VLGWITPNEFRRRYLIRCDFLLFRWALKWSELLKLGGTAALVAAGGSPPPSRWWGILTLWGKAWDQSLFVATALVATSAASPPRYSSSAPARIAPAR